MLPWGDYRPDVTDYAGANPIGATSRVENVLPRGDGYGPFPDIQTYTAALPSACRGAFRALKSDGTVLLFAGTAQKLYLLDNTQLTWKDVTKASVVALSGGSNIGNATGGGGLAAAFDTTTNQAIAACASLAAVTSAYVGKTLAASSAISSANVYGSNDQGYVSGANPSTTIDLYGKQGSAPANSTDGTIIGSITFTDTANESAPRAITSVSSVIWDHVWARVSTASASTLDIAELQLFGTTNYALPSSDQWSFAQFGNIVIATEAADAVQAFNIQTPDIFFSNLAGSPPQSKYVSVVNSFVVLTGLVNNFNRIQWSALGDATGWTAGVNQSDFQDFYEGGGVLSVAGGELSAVVLQTSVTRRMTFQPNTDVVFSFDKVADDVGLLAPLSMVKSSNMIFFLSNSGFRMSADGSVPQNIGKDAVDKMFLAEWDANQSQLMVGFPDPLGTRVYWAYKTVTGNTGFFDKILCFDWKLKRWSRITGVSGEYATALAQAGLTLEGLDAFYPSIDAMTLSLDAFPAAFGKEVTIFDTTNRLGFLRGAAIEAILETSEQGKPAGQTLIRIVRPVTDAPTVYAAVSQRQQVSDTPAWGAESVKDSYGQCPFHTETRHFRIRNRIPAGTTWAYTAGVEVEAIQTGGR